MRGSERPFVPARHAFGAQNSSRVAESRRTPVGGRLEREGINAQLLRLMALITLAVAPVALLLMIQIKFLPYHSEWITWWHRGLLALDLALVWTLWPGYRSGWGIRLWAKKAWGLAVGGVFG